MRLNLESQQPSQGVATPGEELAARPDEPLAAAAAPQSRISGKYQAKRIERTGREPDSRVELIFWGEMSS